MKIECGECQEIIDVPIQREDYERWKDGEFIQNVAPYLRPDDRELLISGTCGPCFDGMFTSDEECICMTASDIGLPEYGDVVAYAHPDCPEHG